MTIEIAEILNIRTDSIVAYFDYNDKISIHLVTFKYENYGKGSWKSNVPGWKYIKL